MTETIETTSPEAELTDKSGATERALPRTGAGKWQLWVGVIFSVVSLILALHDVDLSKVMTALSQANLWVLILAAVSGEITILAKAVRWRLLFALRKMPSLGRSFSILSIGLLANAFVPARLGELVRTYLMGEAEADSKAYILGTIAVEKVSDLLFLVISLGLLLSQMNFPDWLAGPSRATAFTVIAIVLLFLLLDWQNGLVLRGVKWASRFLPPPWQEWLIRQAYLGMSSLRVMRHPRLLGGLFAWSLLICVLGAFTNYLVSWAMGIALPVWASLLLLVVLQVGVAVPSSVGKIGVFHYLAVVTLSVFAVNKEVALGYGVLLHLVVYVPIALVGAYCLWHEKISWQKVVAAAARLSRQSEQAK
jgi:glycosyltransferase 2 family protein